VHPASESDRRHSSRLSPWCASWRRRRSARVAGSRPPARCQRRARTHFRLIAFRGISGQSADGRLLGRLELLRSVDGRLHHDVLRGMRDGRRLRHDLQHQHQQFLSNDLPVELLPGERYPAVRRVRGARLRHRVGPLSRKLRQILRLLHPLPGASLLRLQ